MGYDETVRKRIYDRTSGRCHICWKSVAFANYARTRAKGGWEVDHSRARANGGQDHGSNLYAACISCNRSKGKLTSRTVRAHNGRSRAPMSRSKRAQAKNGNTMGGAAAGVLIGSVLGPPGMFLGGLIGAALGAEVDPESASKIPKRKRKTR